MTYITNTECCGVGEIYSLDEDPKEVVRDMKRHLKRRDDRGWVSNKAIYIFHDAVVNKCGIKLARFIKEHNLGKVASTAPVTNPNTMRKIQAWLWTIDKNAIIKFRVE